MITIIKSLKRSINYKVVQVKLNNKVDHKATITELKHFKKKNNNIVKQPLMQYKQLMHTLSLSSLTESSSITRRKHDIYEKCRSSLELDEIEYEKAFFELYMKKHLLYAYLKILNYY